MQKIEDLDPRDFLLVKGAKVNNLKNIDIAIPRDQLIVITGLSGSGKSSLAFDTIFAEGQRKYVESLSSYARQFLGRMEKPNVEYIRGMAPTIAIEQKVNTRNSRSTVGTSTEIYDYLKLLYSRIGKTYSPISGKQVTKDSVTDVANYIMGYEGKRAIISTPFELQSDKKKNLKILLSKGYSRVLIAGELSYIEDILSENMELPHTIEIMIDRFVVVADETGRFRITDSVQTAFFEGHGYCFVNIHDVEKRSFSNLFVLDGMEFAEPSVSFFNFNNSHGACKTCEGLGKTLGIDSDLVIPDKSLSIYDGAVTPWNGVTMKQKWLLPFMDNAAKSNFPIHKPIEQLTQKEYNLLWSGKKELKGINDFFKKIETQIHKIQYRVLFSRFRGKTICPDCQGTRLRKDAFYVKIKGRSIPEVILMSIKNLVAFFTDLDLTTYEQKVAERPLKEIQTRLNFLENVGLDYLTLNRMTSSLSGGEFQRIKLATTLGSSLVGSIYILDEPSIGLHPRDTKRLIKVLKHLKELGNTVLVVEHEDQIMESADQIIDIGPNAGTFGGEIVFQGKINESIKEDMISSHTLNYLTGRETIKLPTSRRPFSKSIEIVGASENNLKNIDVTIPLGIITAITGVSGSGKSTLVKQILVPALGKILGQSGEKTGVFRQLRGDYKLINQLEFVDQNPIGKSSRSNPATYTKAYDNIRQLFAGIPDAKRLNFNQSYFSFNTEGGRCDMCEGEGTVKIEMQFMADLHLLCESCRGKRFKNEVLEIRYNGKNIAEILDLSVEESLSFFKNHPSIIHKIEPLDRVGLGYIKLGQSANSLSGGEAQRVKLASFLGKAPKSRGNHILFIFDEPTTGLHIHDIRKLLGAINALVEQGNSVVIIEHNMDVIKNVDWIIDLGYEGGDEGGYICFEGTPEKMIKCVDKKNHTVKFLKQKIQQ